LQIFVLASFGALEIAAVLGIAAFLAIVGFFLFYGGAPR
jgi:hypothetical protein